MTLVKQKENAEIIREELRAIDGKYGRYKKNPDIVDVPCPFAASLLGISWDVDLTAGSVYTSGVTFKNSLLAANMGCWDGGMSTPLLLS